MVEEFICAFICSQNKRKRAEFMEKKIGVIGGMGPMATQLFYKTVTEKTSAECDQEHLNMVIVSDASMPDRTKAILAGRYEEVEKKMLEDAKLLESCGCGAIAITCNTAHFFAERIAPKLNIPIIHMIKETAEVIAEKNPTAKIAVLATDGTVQSGLYQKHLEAVGLLPYTPPAEIQEKVMYEIYDCIKKGLPCDDEVWAEIEADVKNAGCKNAIMACTELSVIKADNGLSDFYVDPMEVLAEKVILFSGHEVKR